MAAPRKYTDEQRAAMYALWQQGYEAAEIARRVRAGLASVAAFEIPRRSVHAIMVQIDKERAAPHNLDEAAVAVAQGQSLDLVQSIVDDELVRIKAKQPQHPLSPTELERVEKCAAISRELEKARRRQRRAPAADDGNGSTSPATEGPLDELARREGERQNSAQRALSTAEGRNGTEPHGDMEGEQVSEPGGADDAFTHTRTCPEPPPQSERTDSEDDAGAERAA